MTARESMPFDVVIVGAGPAGLSAAIRLKQLSTDLSICVIDKAAEIGAHTLSGAVIETRALDELLPNWQELGAPITTKAKNDEFLLLTNKGGYKLPTPPQMHNDGNYIVSLSNVVKWLGEQAMNMGIDIFPGFAASEVLIENNVVKGVATGDMGIGKDGKQKDSYQPGVELHAQYTLFAEGCRGSLTEDLFKTFDLRKHADPQTYGIGIKEVWEVQPEKHEQGKIVHTIGWPLSSDTYGGSFLYHLENNMVAVGFVVGLDYKNPYLSPYQEFQRYKLHPKVKDLFEGAKRISYGARALNEGGWQSIPELVFPGGALIGCGAGFLNVAKIKGTHTAMKSGMVAAEALIQAKQKNAPTLDQYPDMLKRSWVYDELYRVRNIRPAFRAGLWAGLAYAAFDTYILRGLAPWTFKQHSDHGCLIDKNKATPIDYPAPDGKITFDRLTSVQLTGTNHEEDQPVHLTLKDETIPVNHNLAKFDGPEARYCPAGVYEYVKDEQGNDALQINAQNCIHCKTCDIKDPCQNIKWVTPEGTGGPRYSNT